MLGKGFASTHVLPRPLRIAQSFPVELSVRVDDVMLLVGLEWRVVAHLLGGRAVSEENMAEALFEHRALIERTIRAHLFAQGMPLSGQVVLDLDDFRFAATG